MKKFLIISGIAVTVGLISYAIYRQYKMILNYCYNISGYRLNTISKDRINFDINLEVKNNSDITVELLTYNLFIYLNGIKVADVKATKNQPLKPKQFSSVIVNVNAMPAEIKEFNDPTLLANILLDFKNTKVKIAGSLAVKVSGIKAEGVPVNIETTVKDMLPSSEQPKTLCV